MSRCTPHLQPEPSASSPDRPRAATTWRVWTWRALAHAVGTLVVLSALAWWSGIMGSQDLSALWMDAQVRAQSWQDLGGLVVISGLLWSSVALGWHVLARRRHTSLRVVRAARGQVMLETLIILPVYLLVMMGSMQLALTSMAGLLTTLGSYQAGRAAAIWLPEQRISNPRRTVSEAVVKDKVRVAVVSAVAPVVASGFASGLSTCDAADNSTTLTHKIEAMEGALNLGILPSLPGGRTSGDRSQLTVGGAFDEGGMKNRIGPKMRFAYCLVDEPAFSFSGDKVTTSIVFNYQMVMPFVELAFGEFRNLHGRSGYYSAIKRSYQVRMQIPPNPVSPLQGAL